MATMAQWGNIKFSVSSSKVFTFANFKRTYSGRWATHNIIGKRPKMEFQGADLDEMFNIRILNIAFRKRVIMRFWMMCNEAIVT